MIQLILNSRTIITTEKSIFYTNFGCYLNLFNISKNSLQIKIVLLKISQLREIYKEILRDIKYQ